MAREEVDGEPSARLCVTVATQDSIRTEAFFGHRRSKNRQNVISENVSEREIRVNLRFLRSPTLSVNRVLSVCSLLQLQTLQLPALRPSNHAVQHRRVRQRLHAGPPSAARLLHRHGQGLRQRRQLRLGAVPAPSHAAQPVPIGRGELRKLPAVAVHGAQLLAAPLPSASLALHRLVLSRTNRVHNPAPSPAPAASNGCK